MSEQPQTPDMENQENAAVEQYMVDKLLLFFRHGASWTETSSSVPQMGRSGQSQVSGGFFR